MRECACRGERTGHQDAVLVRSLSQYSLRCSLVRHGVLSASTRLTVPYYVVPHKGDGEQARMVAVRGS